MTRFCTLWAAILIGALPVDRVDAVLTTNSWLSSTSGKWETLGNWSSGAPTNTDAADFITNAATKVVTIDALTPAGNLTISNLVLSGPVGTVNTLQVTNTPAVPLHVINVLAVSKGATLFITNSTVLAGGPVSGTLSNDGTVTLLGGTLVATNDFTFIGGAAAGQMTVSAGTFDSGVLEVGLGPQGSLSIVNGGVLNNAFGFAPVYIGRAGPGQLTISNSTWVAGSSSPVYLGFSPVQGNLTAVNATIELLSYVYVSFASGATGAVWITGGQTTTTNAGIYLSEDGTGIMTMSNSTWLGQSVSLGDSSGSQATLTLVGGTTTFSSFVDIGIQPSATGTVWLTGGAQLTVTNLSSYTRIGDQGAGQMTVSNSTWNGSTVSVAYAPGSVGALTLVGSTNQFSSDLAIGANGILGTCTGTVWVSGGELVTSNAHVGAVGVGQMTVSNATWQVGILEVGAYAVSDGTLTLVGANTAVSGILAIGAEDPQTTGAVWMAGGQLTATNNPTYVGWYGVGQMAVSNGVWRASEVDVGYGASSQGTLTIAGGTNVFSGDVVVGVFPGATGTLWMTGGQLIVTNKDNLIWLTEYSVGQMTISNGTCLASSLILGDGDSEGTLTMAGGTTTILGDMDVGVEGTQTVWLVGGQLTATNGTTTIGDAGIGRMTISNGLWRARNAVVGLFSGSPGTLTVAGGISSVYSNVTIGSTNCFASGLVLVTSGELHVTNDDATAVLEVRDGTLIQSGGLLDIDRLVVTNPCAHFIHIGGTLIIGLETLTPGYDADGDGIPNGYELANGLDPLNPADANLDDDGDGMSNLQEYLAGTDPTDSASYFHITSVVHTGSNIRVTWMMGPGKTNALQRTAGASGSYSNNFVDIFIVTNTVGSITNFLDVGAATNTPARYYRVRLVP